MWFEVCCYWFAQCGFVYFRNQVVLILCCRPVFTVCKSYIDIYGVASQRQFVLRVPKRLTDQSHGRFV